jgi:hypothetical protein
MPFAWKNFAHACPSFSLGPTSSAVSILGCTGALLRAKSLWSTFRKQNISNKKHGNLSNKLEILSRSMQVTSNHASIHKHLIKNKLEEQIYIQYTILHQSTQQFAKKERKNRT